MIVINQLQTRSEEKQLESYVKARLGKSTSGAPLVRTPVLQVLFSKQHSFIMDVHFYKVIIHFFPFYWINLKNLICYVGRFYTCNHGPSLKKGY